MDNKKNEEITGEEDIEEEEKYIVSGRFYATIEASSRREAIEKFEDADKELDDESVEARCRS